MKYLSMAALATLLLGIPTTGVFAADLESSVYVAPAKSIVDVPVTQEIRDWFTHHQIDGSLIDSPTASVQVKENIDRVLVNGDPVGGNGANAGDSTTHVNQMQLEALIAPALQAALQPGSEARMVIGDRVWTLRG
jgi:hypothetical protein